MAEVTDTLGDFKIRVGTDGADKVIRDLDAIRAGLRQLKADFDGARSSGEGLADLMKGLRRTDGQTVVPVSPSTPGGGGSEGSTPPPPNVAPVAPGKPVPPAPPTEKDSILQKIYRLLAKDSKEKAKYLGDISTVMKAGNIFGSRSLSMGGEMIGQFATFAKFFGPAAIAVAVASAIAKWWERDREQQGSGKNTEQGLATEWRNSRKSRLDYDAITRLGDRLIGYYANYDKETGTITNIDEARAQARNAAESSSVNIATDLSVFRQRGEMPSWMREMLLSGIDTSGIKDVESLAGVVKNFYRTANDDQWRTFKAKTNLPSYIYDIASETDEHAQARERLGKEFDRYTIHGSDKAEAAASGIYATLSNNANFVNADAITKTTELGIAIRGLSQASDNAAASIKKAMAEADNLATLMPEKYKTYGLIKFVGSDKPGERTYEKDGQIVTEKTRELNPEWDYGDRNEYWSRKIKRIKNGGFRWTDLLGIGQPQDYVVTEKTVRPIEQLTDIAQKIDGSVKGNGNADAPKLDGNVTINLFDGEGKKQSKTLKFNELFGFSQTMDLIRGAD